MKDWVEIKEVWLKANKGIPELVLRWLHLQGFEPDSVAGLYDFDYESGLHDPMLLPDMEQAVARIIEALSNGEQITIFGDYDADGLPATALMSAFFDKIGYKNYDLIIPERNIDGFGMKPSHIDQIVDSGSRLIITVDCGSASIDAIKQAGRHEIDVIVTDHHEVPDDFNHDLVVALINPMSAGSKYPYPKICGATVAFKLVQAILENLRTDETWQNILEDNDVVIGWEKWLLDLVAIATVGDMMPLRDENRTLVYYGLKVLNQTRNHGLRALVDSCQLERGSINETDIAFRLAPRLNAASRVGKVQLAIDLLTANDPLSANRLAGELEALNKERKNTLTQMVKQAHKKIGLADDFSNSVLAVGDPSWLPGMCGLLASRMVEEYGVSSFVWGRGQGQQLKGSCRAADGDDVYQIMSLVEPGVLSGFGGHVGAGGFVLEESVAHQLGEALAHAKTKFDERTADSDKPAIENSAEVLQVDPDELGQDLLTAIDKLGPFGIGFPRPKFQVTCRPTFQSFGKSGDHLKVVISRQLSGVMWRTTIDDLSVVEGDQVRIVSQLEYDSYSKRPRLLIESIQPD